METVGSRGKERVRTILALVAACLCLVLAACAGGATSTTQASTATTTSGSPGTGTTTSTSGATQPPQATDTQVTQGTPGVLGTGDYCASQPNVTATLPNTIPTYPGAQMLLAQAQGNSGAFALCSTDGVQAVDAYYAAQLPSNGWQQLTNDQVSSSAQLTACMGQCQSATPTPGTHTTQLSITIEPDTSNGYQTQIEIIYSES